MAHRRLFYAITLLGSLALQIFNEAYVAHFLLVVVLALPFLSLAISLPVMLRCRIFLRAADAPRESAALWRVQITVPAGLPLARLRLRLVCKNLMTGAEQTHRLRRTALRGNQILTVPADTAHCGQLTCSCVRAQVCDYLGLVTLRRAVEPASMLVLPLPGAAEPLPEHAPTVRPRQDPGRRAARTGEDYELRPYRPGDPLRLVHWKASAKHDDLQVREMMADLTPTLCLSFDRFGSAVMLDRTLDRLYALCLSQLAQQAQFYIGWLAEEGVCCNFRVKTEPELLACLARAMSLPTPEAMPENAPLPAPVQTDGPVLHYHIAAQEEVGPCSAPVP